MKKQLIYFLAAAISASGLMVACTPEPKAYNQGINIIPVPVELTETPQGAVFTLDKKTVIVAGQGFEETAAYLANKIKTATGYDLPAVSDVPAGGNYISLTSDSGVTHKEGYTLVSTPDGVTVSASTADGMFFGIQTLLQLLPADIESSEQVKGVAWTVPAVSIKDQPRFDYRGVHLDVVRHFLPVDAVKKHLDVMSMYKYNKLHWHLTDDQGWRIEIKKYPDLQKGSTRIEGDGSAYGGWYTQEEVKEIVAYAAERHIEIIPEIEMPGHAKAALVPYPQFSCTGGPFDNPRITWGVEDDVFCAGNEQVFTFLEDVLTEVSQLFPSRYIHIGGDECPKVRWQQCPKCQAVIDREGLRSLKKRTDALGKVHTPEEALQSWFITRMDGFVTDRLGKTIIGWDEILEGGLAPSAIVMSWRGEDGGIAAAKLGHRAIMTPNSAGYYLDHYQGAAEVEPAGIGGFSTLERVYGYNPIPAALTEDQHHLIWGAQGNLWSEYILSPEHMEYMAYPRILAIAEVDWSPMDRKDWTDFQRRLNNNLVRLDYHNVNYHIPQPEDSVRADIIEFTDGEVEIPLSNTRNYKMVYTVDGSEPGANAAQYAEPIRVDRNTTLRVATVLPHGKMSRSRTIEVKKVQLRPAVAVEGDQQGMLVKVAPGLHLTDEQMAGATFGAQQAVSRFGRTTPVGANDSPKGIEFDMYTPSLAVYEGYVEFPADGVYGLATDMDELWIDGERIIKNGQEAASRHLRKKTTRALAKGKHAYKLVFNNMIRKGWPQSWNSIGIWTRGPQEDGYSRIRSERFTYVKK